MVTECFYPLNRIEATARLEEFETEEVSVAAAVISLFASDRYVAKNRNIVQKKLFFYLALLEEEELESEDNNNWFSNTLNSKGIISNIVQTMVSMLLFSEQIKKFSKTCIVSPGVTPPRRCLA